MAIKKSSNKMQTEVASKGPLNPVEPYNFPKEGITVYASSQTEALALLEEEKQGNPTPRPVIKLIDRRTHER